MASTWHIWRVRPSITRGNSSQASGKFHPICSQDHSVFRMLQERGGLSAPSIPLFIESILGWSIGILVPLAHQTSSSWLLHVVIPSCVLHLSISRSIRLFSQRYIILPAANKMHRFVSTTWLARPPVRNVQVVVRLHMSGTRQWSGIPNRSRLRVRRVGSGECSHACVHGLPQLLGQWRYAGTQWRRSRTACQ